jgi:nucleoside-diphosphate-sugar epimerase
MKILVIGGTNFIGPPVVRRLCGMGHEVTVFHRGKSIAELPSDVHHILGESLRHTFGNLQTAKSTINGTHFRGHSPASFPGCGVRVYCLH